MGGIQYAVRSHIGRRPANQDEIRLPTPSESRFGRGILFAVADGMGGHRGAAQASRMACEGITQYHARRLPERGPGSARVLQRLLVEVILRISRQIRFEGRKDKALEDMGTTLSCLVLTDRHCITAHVGDSRIYRLRGKHLTCLTTDHTFVQDMILEGEIAPEKADAHPLRHLLTRAVGTMEPLERVDTRIDPRSPRDRFLLCTDGLYNAVDDGRLAERLADGGDPPRTAVALVDEALGNGARDNITAMVIIPSPPAAGTIVQTRRPS